MERSKYDYIIGLVKSLSNGEEEIVALNRLRNAIVDEIQDYIADLPKFPNGECSCDEPEVFELVHRYLWKQGGYVKFYCLKCGGEV